MSLRTILEQQQALITEYKTLMDTIDGISRLVDTDHISRTKEVGLERLIYASRRNDEEVNNLYYRTVLVMWKKAASDLVNTIEASPKLRFYRFFLLDRIAGCGSSWQLVAELNGELRELEDPVITRTMTLEDTRQTYIRVVEKSGQFLSNLSERKTRIVAGMAALCSIFGISVAFLTTKAVAMAKWLISLSNSIGTQGP